jgi:3-deoxy-D-manno-octulosonic-acid transferase
MDLSLAAYNLALGLAGPAWPGLALGARLAGRWAQVGPRCGLYRDLAREDGPGVWLQAVSVGEVAVASAVAEELLDARPGLRLTVTSSTEKGLETARRVLGQKAAVAPFPLDLPWAVMAAASRIKPTVYASLETEIWPNLLGWLHRQGVQMLLLNGRLSPRSFPRYRKVRWLVEPALRRFAALSMIGPDDAARVIALGADPARVRVDGNAKYAGLLQRAKPEMLDRPAQLLALMGAPLLVAGSVRSGEEGPVLGALAKARERHPSAVLAVAPRHVENSGKWLAACGERGLKAERWSALGMDRPRQKDTAVVVVDVMGELMGIYGLARCAFLGASLVPLGGQNPMEPAAWGAPCCFGPSMEDFDDARQALVKAGAAREVAGEQDLAACWDWALTRSEEARAAGAAGRQVVAGWSGAAKTAAALILERLERREGRA